jgi:hypothetical protein
LNEYTFNNPFINENRLEIPFFLKEGIFISVYKVIEWTKYYCVPNNTSSDKKILLLMRGVLLFVG